VCTKESIELWPTGKLLSVCTKESRELWPKDHDNALYPVPPCTTYSMRSRLNCKYLAPTLSHHKPKTKLIDPYCAFGWEIKAEYRTPLNEEYWFDFGKVYVWSCGHQRRQVSKSTKAAVLHLITCTRKSKSKTTSMVRCEVQRCFG